MKPQKFRWSKVYESSEEELLDFMKARGIKAERRHVDEFEKLDKQTLEQDTTIWCAEGSFNLEINGQNISMQPGDAIPLLAKTTLEISAGMSGCAIYQSLTSKRP